MASNIGKDLPHLIVLAVLVVVLLVVLTKFQWIHCSAIPGWCNIYCNQIIRSNPQVALLYGDEGIGDPQLLENAIRRVRPNIVLAPIRTEDLSSGLLKRFDLVIMTHAKNISSRQTTVLFDYLQKGGSMILVGDSATSHYYDPYDVLLAERANQTFYDRLDRELALRNLTYSSSFANLSIRNWRKGEDYDILVNRTVTRTGFRKLTAAVAAAYNRTVSRRGTFINLSIANYDHLIGRGLVKEFTTEAREYAIVHPDPASTDILAFIKEGTNRYPGIMETRFAGRVLYFAFPPEYTASPTLFQNVWDYLTPC